MSNKYYVLIKEIETDKIETRMGPMGERKAERVANGASINLNHDKYYVDMIQKDEEEVE